MTSLECSRPASIALTRLSPHRGGQYSFLASLDVLSHQWHQPGTWWLGGTYVHSCPALWDIIGCQLPGVVRGGEQGGVGWGTRLQKVSCFTIQHQQPHTRNLEGSGR